MCPKENSEKFLLNIIFLKHLKTIHNINVKQSIPNFKSLEEFDAWEDRVTGKWIMHVLEKINKQMEKSISTTTVTEVITEVLFSN